MLRLATDENIHGGIIRGLLRREPALDIVRVQDVGMGSTADPLVLEWAAVQGRVLVTGDLDTMVGFALGRVQAGLPMPGVLALLENAAIGPVIDDVLLTAHCCTAEEMKDQIQYVPF